VHIASWGHGLWFLQKTTGCSKTDPLHWTNRFGPVAETETSVGVLGRKPDEPPAPRGLADPGVAKLFVTTPWPASGVAGIGPDHVLEIWGRNFPAGQEVTLLIRTDELFKQSLLKQSVRVEKDGTFASKLQLPRDLPHGTHTIEAVGGAEGKILAVAEFFKSYAADEYPGRDAPR
jgi:hypothetical protein